MSDFEKLKMKDKMRVLEVAIRMLEKCVDPILLREQQDIAVKNFKKDMLDE